MVRAGGLHRSSISAALDKLDAAAPGLLGFRDSATHPEDNRDNDDVIYAAAAMRWRPGRPEYVLDLRTAHGPLGELFAATESALVTVAPDDGPLPSFDNGLR